MLILIIVIIGKVSSLWASPGPMVLNGRSSPSMSAQLASTSTPASLTNHCYHE